MEFSVLGHCRSDRLCTLIHLFSLIAAVGLNRLYGHKCSKPHNVPARTDKAPYLHYGTWFLCR
ncbi:MAG: hypothetical protein D6695_07585 [Planctomycetota bacterium]|nr:MAG: hypothetical protein D6695_07585 [Planctomycetota bacterium]